MLAKDAYCSPEVLKELGRTPSIRARMKKVGFFPRLPEESSRFERPRPTRSREVLAKFGVDVLKPPKTHKTPPPLPRTVRIGAWRRNGQEIRLDRAGLFDRVWSQPVAKVAEKWGLSGPGLAKACRRLKIPMPPRGYWAKLEAGRRLRRPRLPKLPSGEAQEIVIWAPE
jgi:hypothetical protein